MRFRCPAALGALCVLVLSLSGDAAIAYADEPAQGAPLDDLDLVKLLNVEVSTASKTAESLEDAPAVITVVTREDIVRWGYRSVAEVLTHSVGFYVLDDHILPNAGVRGVTGGLGAESGVIKVMIDGRSVAFRTTSGNWLGMELVPLESVRQIEIMRGPASALYGADAFLGVVNIITESPDELRPVRARVSGGVTGQNPGGTMDIVGGTRVGNFDVMLGAATEYTDRTGLKLPPQSPAPTLPTDIGDRRTSQNVERRSLVLQSRLGYRVADTGHVILSAYASGLERGGDFAQWAQLTNGTDAQERSVGTVVSLGQYRINLDGLLQVTDELDLALQSTYFQGGVLPADKVEVASDLFYAERNTAYQGVDSTLEARWTPTARLNAIVGTETIYDHERLPSPRRVDRSTGDSVEGSSENGRGSVDLLNVGTYLSTSYQLIEQWLKLTSGLRYDHHSKYGDQVSGRTAAVSRWTRTFVAKLLYGKAFKAPSPYLLYAVPLRPGDTIGNPSLKPQHIHTLEGQLSWQALQWLGVTSNVSQSWLQNKAEFTPQGINQAARNVASQRALSWESRIEARYREDFNAYASSELLYSSRDLGQDGYAATLIGSQNVVYPPWIVRGGAMVGIPGPSVPLEVGAQAVLVGPRRAADTGIVENGKSYHLPTYLWLNASISTRALYLIRGHESRVALRGRNLLGDAGPDPGFAGFDYPLSPREVFLELRHIY